MKTYNAISMRITPEEQILREKIKEINPVISDSMIYRRGLREYEKDCVSDITQNNNS